MVDIKGQYGFDVVQVINVMQKCLRGVGWGGALAAATLPRVQ